MVEDWTKLSPSEFGSGSDLSGSLRDDDQRRHRVGLVGAAAELWDDGALRGTTRSSLLPGVGRAPRSPHMEVALGLPTDVEEPRPFSTYVKCPFGTTAGGPSTKGGRPRAAGMDDQPTWGPLINQRGGRRGPEIRMRRARKTARLSSCFAREGCVPWHVLGEGRTRRCSTVPRGESSRGSPYEPPFALTSDYGPGGGQPVLDGRFRHHGRGGGARGLVHTGDRLGRRLPDRRGSTGSPGQKTQVRRCGGPLRRGRGSTDFGRPRGSRTPTRPSWEALEPKRGKLLRARPTCTPIRPTVADCETRPSLLRGEAELGTWKDDGEVADRDGLAVNSRTDRLGIPEPTSRPGALSSKWLRGKNVELGPVSRGPHNWGTPLPLLGMLRTPQNDCEEALLRGG